MGVYDTIIAKCPECAGELHFQTKSGECVLADYFLKDFATMPDPAAMLDVNRHAPQTCACGKKYRVHYVLESSPRILSAELIEVP